MARPERAARRQASTDLPSPGEPQKTDPKPAPDVRRISVLVGPDGRVLLDRMHGATRDSLKTALADRELMKGLGLASDVGTGPQLPPQLGLALAGAISQIEVGIVGRATGAPRSLVESVAKLSPDEAQLVGEQLNRVLSKHGAAFLEKWGDEVGLAVLLTSLTMSKIAAVREVMARMPTGSPRVVPMRPDEPTPDSVQ